MLTCALTFTGALAGVIFGQLLAGWLFEVWLRHDLAHIRRESERESIESQARLEQFYARIYADDPAGSTLPAL
jgi:hypothetical protein